MHGDFSRDSFDPAKHFSRVLQQQGRVLLDADSNEQVAIFWHYLHTLAADLIGPHGGPQADAERGFDIGVSVGPNNRLDDLTISPGRYYVDGLLAENGQPATYYYRKSGEDRAAVSQPDGFYDPQRDRLPEGFPLLAYLVVWERLITSVEDPEIREVALGSNGPDTTARARVVWQVRATRTGPNGQNLPDAFDRDQAEKLWPEWVRLWQPDARGRLMARAYAPPIDERDVCAVPPESRYRRAENQHYRVEIHTGGKVGEATFKWSRDNGSQIFPIEDIDGRQVTVTTLGRDIDSTLEVGDWVEIVDDAYVVAMQPATLSQIEAIDPVERIVTLAETPDGTTGTEPLRHPFLRRWNHQAGDERRGGLKLGPDNALLLAETEADGTQRWLPLEDGVQIAFEPGATYRSGDYWLIPARTETGDVIWPGSADDPELRAPNGPTFHFAPLALIRGLGANQLDDLRRVITPIARS